MIEVVLTTGAIRRAKLQIVTTNTHLFTGRMSFLSPNQQCQSTERNGGNYHYWNIILIKRCNYLILFFTLPKTLLVLLFHISLKINHNLQLTGIKLQNNTMYWLNWKWLQSFNNWRAPWKNRISSTSMKLRKSLVKPVTRQNIWSCSVLSPEIIMHDAFNVILWTSADIRVVVHDDLGWKNRTTRYNTLFL